MKSLVTFIFFTIQAFAADYYVDYATGSDSNAGTSTGAPFKHAPGDPRATGNVPGTLSAGDNVIFKGGVTYSFTSGATDDYIDIPSSGTSGNSITYISGHDSAYNWGTGNAVIDGEFANHTYSSRLGVITFVGEEYITIDGLKIVNAFSDLGTSETNRNVVGAIGWTGSAAQTGVIIQNCIIEDAIANGIFIMGVYGSPETNYPTGFTIDNNTISSTHGHNIMLRYGLTDFVITNNDLSTPGTTTGQADNISFSYDDGSDTGGTEQRRHIVRGNVMRGSEDKGHILFQENTLDVVVEKNHFTGDTLVGSLLIAGHQENLTIRNNLFDSDTPSSGFEGTIRFRTDQGNIADHDNIDIHNNTFVGRSYTPGSQNISGIIYVHSGNDSGSTIVSNLDIRNNIFDTTANDDLLIWFESDGASGTVVDESTLTIDYNVYEAGTNTDPFYYGADGALSFADWKTASSQDANSTEADLTFSDEAGGDYSLAASDTAAIDSGVDLSGFFTDDYDGTTRSTPYDIGAFEVPAPGSAYTGQLRLDSSGAIPSLSNGASFKLD